MIFRPGDTQEVPGVGVFVWDGKEFWILEDIKRTYGEMYTILRDMDKYFDIKDGG